MLHKNFMYSVPFYRNMTGQIEIHLIPFSTDVKQQISM